jgi:hypothetical protein
LRHQTPWCSPLAPWLGVYGSELALTPSLDGVPMRWDHTWLHLCHRTFLGRLSVLEIIVDVLWLSSFVVVHGCRLLVDRLFGPRLVSAFL